MLSVERKMEKRRFEIRTQRKHKDWQDWRDEVELAILDIEAGDVEAKMVLQKLLKRVADECQPNGAHCLNCVYGGNSERFVNGKTACELAADFTNAKLRSVSAKEMIEESHRLVARVNSEIDELKRLQLRELEKNLAEAKRQLDAAKAEDKEAAAAFAAIAAKWQ